MNTELEQSGDVTRQNHSSGTVIQPHITHFFQLDQVVTIGIYEKLSALLYGKRAYKHNEIGKKGMCVL